MNNFHSDNTIIPLLYPVIENDNFLKLILETVEQHRSFWKRKIWLSKSSKYSLMNEDEIMEAITRGSKNFEELLSSVQIFNTIIYDPHKYLSNKWKIWNIWSKKYLSTPCGILFLWQIISQLLYWDKDRKNIPYPEFNNVT